jgi:DNA transposition AAA+ family ATPase
MVDLIRAKQAAKDHCGMCQSRWARGVVVSSPSAAMGSVC